MRILLVAIAAWLAACYSPHYGDCFISCATSQLCPSDLYCDGHDCRTSETPEQTCLEVLGDAGLGGDTPSGTDSDGDTVADDHDNCPGKANMLQEDEDSDGLGDVCDPCPPLAMFYDHINIPTGLKDANLDSDQDGVGDGCDPEPMMGGDHILYFAGFKTQPPPPATINKTGNANVTYDGAANVTASTPQDTVVIGWPSPPENKTRVVSAQVTIAGGNFPSMSGGGTVDRATAIGDQGMSCALWKTSAPIEELLILPTTNLNSGSAYNTGSTYIVSERHNLNSMTFACTFEQLPLSIQVDFFNNGASMMTNSLPANPVIGIRATSTNVRYDWVMIVD